MTQKLPVPTTETALTKNKMVLPAALLITGGILGAFFTHFTVVSLVFAALGLILFMSKKLVKSSLELSSGPVDLPLDETLSSLKHEVAQTKYLNRQGKLGEKAYAQVVHLDSSYQFLAKILVQKFNPTELTFDRYEKAINEAVFKIVDNLKHTARVITLLDHQDPPSAASLEEVQVILKANSEALTNMDGLAEALKGINRADPVPKHFEETLEKLKVLADRAQAYSTNTKE